MDRLSFKYKTILCFCLGVYLGYCLVYWLSGDIRHHQHIHHSFKHLDTPSTQHRLSSLPVSQNNFLLVAVMTTRKYLKTRAEAIYRTWGQRVPGRIVFFVGGKEPYNGHLPVIILENITENTYPPQTKSFAMLEYVATHFVNDYEWFMRSDDDVFVKTDKLERFLRSVNSSKSLYIGQPGTGTQEETGKLGLHNSAPYCMGGPGVFFTRTTLKKIRTHLKNCLLNAVTLHEDTELGRCVQRYAGIACSNAFQFAHLFYQNYKNKSGSFTHQLGRAEERAITLHPIKQHLHMFRLDVYFSGSRLERLKYKVRKLSMAVKNINQYIEERRQRDALIDNGIGSRSRTSQFDSPVVSELLKNLEDDNSWDFVTRGKFYSIDTMNPVSELGLKGRSISIRLSRTVVSSDPRFRNYQIRPQSYQRLSNGQVLEHIVLVDNPRQAKSLSVRTKQLFSELEFHETEMALSTQTIWTILPIYRNSKLYSNFLSMLARALERFRGKIVLCVVLFQDSLNDYKFSKHHSDVFSDFSTKLDIRVIERIGTFSKTRAITVGLKIIPIDGLVLFMDVNFAFDSAFLHRIIQNTVPGKQAYYPLYFNRYNPKFVCRGSRSCDSGSLSFDSSSGTFNFNNHEILSVYKSDLVKIQGIWTDTSGESSSSRLFERCLTKLYIFQAVDPFLFRFYQHCDKRLSKDQLKRCEKSRFQFYGDEISLLHLIQINKRVV